jgi:6-pyruvoyltetrahydropterin/6-carboxytetrahydropterin synthase
MSYLVVVKREFMIQHYHLADNGIREGDLHSHRYIVEVAFEGEQLDQKGYLIDICEVEPEIDALVDYLKEKPLNELPEFKGLNPSLEQMARKICKVLAERIRVETLSALSLRIWEDGNFAAGYRNIFV